MATMPISRVIKNPKTRFNSRVSDLAPLCDVTLVRTGANTIGSEYCYPDSIRDLGYEPHQRDNWYRLVN